MMSEFTVASSTWLTCQTLPQFISLSISLSKEVLEVYQVPVAASLWQGKAQHPYSQVTSGFTGPMSRGGGWGGLEGWTLLTLESTSLESSRGHVELSLFFPYVCCPGPGDPELISCSGDGPELWRSTLLSELWLTMAITPQGFIGACQSQHPRECRTAGPGRLCLLVALSRAS